jgi:predicted phosphodiesterase
MRVAVFSDVHGNLSALEAVLADIQAQAVDDIVFAGDLCLVGPRPAECLRRVRDAAIPSLYGNTDDWVLERQQPPERLAALARWTRAQLSDAEQAWLDGLPFARRIAPNDDPAQTLLVVHANPQDVNQIIFPPEAEQIARYGRIRQSDADLTPLLAELDVSTLAFGHLHIPNERRVAGVRLLNVSAVSMPGDGDPRARYGLLTWTRGGWRCERRAAAYAVTAEISAYAQARPPGWEAIVAALRAQGYFPQKV